MARRKRRRTRAKPKRKAIARKAPMPSKITGDSKTFAFVATFFSIIGFVAALILWKKDRYAMYYARQSLVLFVLVIILGIISFLIPIIGVLFGWLLIIAMIILWIMTWVYALSGGKKDVLVIGHYAKHIDL